MLEKQIEQGYHSHNIKKEEIVQKVKFDIFFLVYQFCNSAGMC